MILALALAAAAVSGDPAAAPTCAEAHAAIASLNQARPESAGRLGLECADGKAVRILAPAALPPIAEKTPNFYRPPASDCRDIERRVSNDQRETLKKLGRLPNGAAIYAVERQIGGCAVPAPMGYHPPSLPGQADHPQP